MSDSGLIEVRPGRRLAWSEDGDGPPLLLVNGYAATGADWDPAFVDTLAAHFRVIRPDNAGLGGSRLDDGEEVGGVAAMTTDAVALLDHLEVASAVVCGWSMGGFIAQSLARAVPERVAGLALIDTHTGGPTAVDAAPGIFQLLTDHSGTPREQASRLLSLLFPPELTADADERLGDAAAAARAQMPARVLDMQAAAIVAWHGRPAPLPPIPPGTPTAIVHGGRDTTVPPGNVEALVAAHPGAHVTILDGCAHAPMDQEPEAVASAILSAATARTR
jgi:pimeloyl-ACP methyl ester carboxylesterase